MTFDDFYTNIWRDRWPALRQALLRDTRAIARWNRFTSVPPQGQPFDGLPACYQADHWDPPRPDSDGIAPYYLMDAASVAAAVALDVQRDDHVLDLCAAPGGKTLVLAERLGPRGSLVANDLSRARQDRLKRVLSEYLPPRVRAQVKVTGIPAEKWCLRETETFDRILADVPCSSEQHVLRDPAALAEWTPARPRQLARRQYAILASAVQVLKPGGRVVYSTCSINPAENDDVIDRILDRKKNPVALLPTSAPFGEPTRNGWQILPDRTPHGPIYFAALKRL